jgi:activator of 2-hydroxyglutaryl-CoA dehydratase
MTWQIRFDKEAISMITTGIDCGAMNSKTVILKEGKIIGKGMVLSGKSRYEPRECPRT